MALKRLTFVLAFLALFLLVGCGPQVVGYGVDGTPTMGSYDEWYHMAEETRFAETQIALYGTYTPTYTPSPTFTPTPLVTPTLTPLPTATPLGGSLGTCYIFDWVNPDQYLGEYPPGVLPACSEDSIECVQKRILCYRDGVIFAQYGEAAEQKIVRETKPWWPWAIGGFIGVALLILLPGLFIYMRAMFLQTDFESVAENVAAGGSSGRELRRISDPVISVSAFKSMMRQWNRTQANDFIHYLLKDARWAKKINSREVELVSLKVWYQALNAWDKKQTRLFVQWMQQKDASISSRRP